MTGSSWGRYPKVEQSLRPLNWRSEVAKAFRANSGESSSLLPYGQGRSYGDACLNEQGLLLETSGLNRLIAFDDRSGLLTAETGLTLQDLLSFSVPRGWFLPVSPGTQFVSLGGAVANDIHGKNHHVAGTFGRHVKSLQLQRSDGEELTCSLEENSDLFTATIAGLGLTGFISTVTVQLIPITSPLIQMESVKFQSLEEFLEIAKSSDEDFDYTVAWIDCIHDRPHLGRGIFMRGNHVEHEKGSALSKKELAAERTRRSSALLRVPIDFPPYVLNRWTLGLFNKAYYHKQSVPKKVSKVHYQPFFYPLDSVLNWNRIYGKGGFLQFQCVVPTDNDNQAIKAVFKRVVEFGKASFLAVIKEFGDIVSPGMLSFPRPGITICLDFAYEGERTLRLFRELEDLVVEANGALYPAKDACMTAASFQQFYPRWREFREFIDPKCSSSFWRRVSKEDSS